MRRELSCAEARALIGRPDVLLVDVRDTAERERDGAIPGAVHAPIALLAAQLRPGGTLHEAAMNGRRLLFYCAGGPRSARAVEAATATGFTGACHIEGGIRAWYNNGGRIEPIEPADPS